MLSKLSIKYDNSPLCNILIDVVYAIGPFHSYRGRYCDLAFDRDGHELRYCRDNVPIFDVFNDPEFRNIMFYVTKKVLALRETKPYKPCYKNVIDILKKEHDEELTETTKD